jgi:hypothetical protein
MARQSRRAISKVKLELVARKATPAPPVGLVQPGGCAVSDRRKRRDPIEPFVRGGELSMPEMMDYQSWKERHEEILREAELSRQAKSLRATRRRRAGGRSALVWEIERQAGRLLKFMRTLRNTG